MNQLGFIRAHTEYTYTAYFILYILCRDSVARCNFFTFVKLLLVVKLVVVAIFYIICKTIRSWTGKENLYVALKALPKLTVDFVSTTYWYKNKLILF